MNFDLKLLEKLANIVYEQDLSEISLENEEESICLKREKNVEKVMPQGICIPPTTVTSQVISQPQIAETPKKTQHTGTPVISPMAGTFYNAPSPESEPFVKLGDTVATGQVVCIIEAMKLMNEIEAEASGKITEICVENGQPVEQGQVIMYVG